MAPRLMTTVSSASSNLRASESGIGSYGGYVNVVGKGGNGGNGGNGGASSADGSFGSIILPISTTYTVTAISTTRTTTLLSTVYSATTLRASIPTSIAWQTGVCVATISETSLLNTETATPNGHEVRQPFRLSTGDTVGIALGVLVFCLIILFLCKRMSVHQCFRKSSTVDTKVVPVTIAPVSPHVPKFAPNQVRNNHFARRDHVRTNTPVDEAGSSSTDASRGSERVHQFISEHMSRPMSHNLQGQTRIPPVNRNDEVLFYGQHESSTPCNTQPPSYAELTGSNEVRLKGGSANKRRR